MSNPWLPKYVQVEECQKLYLQLVHASRTCLTHPPDARGDVGTYSWSGQSYGVVAESAFFRVQLILCPTSTS